ncbi:type III-A CRISPR-associated protein Cas10/Csm1 [Desulforamulus hydrothermalis]|uniref:CRISPR system single-strand-specific deoxyribonuclease Cas10/Csm1 (subtype III-A) n=1 Tax=Desulforamulus hydrothermalis Lam5 = DSM 18033 TaxID=1121428 RepID=K8DYB1_9FIRM|nr:type III-A CRISPR-associated protein Cas10/Csm1 [Desulforamulus hydrothermalis]CCO07705.1 CRISPR-associated protein, Csm1 family [Desulforamulus hydrothermalis Lam5 = DSM 18033]SHH33333.1 CRISPR-associated protein Cas10/Csm1, subtype III-A/MTUBE [Desulforamulus hydrothermalis Lam5 = DSM 18033]
MNKEYQTILLAGLLHDIGKFLQKGDFAKSLKVSGKHPALSAGFVKAWSLVFEKVTDVQLLIELVQRHHESHIFPSELLVQQADPKIRPLAYLISTADNYSSAERGEQSGEYRDYKTVPLASVFARLKLNHSTPEVYHYKLHTLNPVNAFPKSFKTLDLQQTNKYLNAFGEEFKTLATSINLAEFNCLFTHLLALLQRYTWCIPSNTQETLPDISLFDHLRTTSAIAACLYRYHEEKDSLKNEQAITDKKENKFRIIVGDISGIQNYIFDIANIGVGGVAKRLRARSFFLNMLSEIISHRLIEIFGLPITNVVMSSGGKFYVLVPNISGSEQKIVKWQNELDQWSVNEFNGEIVINLAQTTFNGQAFCDFGGILAELSEELNHRKRTPLKGYLVNNGTWASEQFVINLSQTATELCRSCNKRTVSYSARSHDDLCWHCQRDLHMGSLLPSTEYIAFTRSNVPAQYKRNTFHIYENYSISLFSHVPAKDYPAYLVYKLTGSEVGEIANHPALPRFTANYIPLAHEDNCSNCLGCQDEQPSPGQPLYFDCLANRARGRKLLGYLKADVDNLGQLFVFGLRNQQADRNSISRIATMSRMLDLFFSGRVEQLLNNQFNNCYTVFSGGDDLLIVGPWDEIIKLAIKVQKEFSEFTNNNTNITLSAAVSLLKPGIPVSRSVVVAENALEQSKETVLKGETEGRNQLTFLGRTCKWSKAEQLLNSAERLAGWVNNDTLSTGFVRKLLGLFKIYKLYYDNGDARGLKYLPLLTYTVARYFPPANEFTKDKLNADKLNALLWTQNLKNIDHEDLVYLDLLVKYALYAKE